MRLLLLSNSTNYGRGYLDHAAEAIRALFGPSGRVLFVPFALQDQPGYWAVASRRFEALGLDLDRMEEGPAGRRAVESAAGVFVGGGNTFRLLDRLQRSGLVEPLRRRVLAGMPYLGSSAGTVIAAPTIKTTNDMPIVSPASFDSLALVPFQINCHYQDPDRDSRHMGETRDKRLQEYLEENDALVVGLREGAWLLVETGSGEGGPKILLDGHSARIFRRGTTPTEHQRGEYLALGDGWSSP